MALVFRTLLLALLILGCSQGAKDNRAERVVVDDSAGLIDMESKAAIDSLISALQSDVGPELEVWTITSLDGRTIEKVSLDHVDGRLGRKEFNDGLLILLAADERKVRIEVGYGLEKIIKDEIAARIIREQMAPHFRQGEYGRGVFKGLKKIDSLIRSNRALIGT